MSKSDTPLMDFHVSIDRCNTFYRESTKEWCIHVVAITDNCCISVTYPAKTLNKARHDMLRKLSRDIFDVELQHRLQTHQFDKLIKYEE